MKRLGKPSDQTVSFGQVDDLLVGLNLCADTAFAILESASLWKWCVIAAHSSLQSAMVLTLSGSAGIGALRDRLIGKWLAWFEKGRGLPPGIRPPPSPDSKLADFMTLVDRIQDQQRMNAGGGMAISLSDVQFAKLKSLNDMRNLFMHYPPQTFVFTHGEMARAVIAAVETAELLVTQNPTSQFMARPDALDLVKGKVSSIRMALAPIVEHLDAILASEKV